MAFLDEFAAVPRNKVIQDVGRALMQAIDAFEAGGLNAVRTEWEAMDAHAGQRLRVRLSGGRTLSGIATGLGADGSLQLQTRQGMRAVTSGRVVSARAR